jgi:hypothetical protein
MLLLPVLENIHTNIRKKVQRQARDEKKKTLVEQGGKYELSAAAQKKVDSFKKSKAVGRHKVDRSKADQQYKEYVEKTKREMGELGYVYEQETGNNRRCTTCS